jgi:hypothetical protein
VRSPSLLSIFLYNDMPYPSLPSKVLIGTKVGRTKHRRVMPGGALEGEEHRVTKTTSVGGGRKTSSLSPSTSAGGGVGVGISSYFVGRKLDEHRGAFLLERPIVRGRVVDGGWDAMELIWEVSFFSPQLYTIESNEDEPGTVFNPFSAVFSLVSRVSNGLHIISSTMTLFPTRLRRGRSKIARFGRDNDSTFTPKPT